MLAANLQRGMDVSCSENIVAVPLQPFSGDLANHVVVFHQDDLFSAALRVADVQRSVPEKGQGVRSDKLLPELTKTRSGKSFFMAPIVNLFKDFPPASSFGRPAAIQGPEDGYVSHSAGGTTRGFDLGAMYRAP